MKEVIDVFRQALRGDQYDFTKGNIKKAIVILSIPMILEMVMEALFALVDVFFVSKLGNNAVTTVGLTESVVTLVYSIAIGLSMAATAMVARRIGEKKVREAAKAAAQAIVLGLLFSLIISVIGLLYSADILELMGASEQVVAEGKRYTQWIFGGNFVIMLLFLLNGVFRGAGNATIAMRSLWISNGINIILDPCLIFGIGPFPELGITGAAVATNIGRGVGVAYQLYILFSGLGIIKLKMPDFRVHVETVVRLFKVSLGGMMQYIIASASWIFMMRIVATFGEEAVTGYTIAIRLIVFTILPAWGMANAAATLVGQNLGANEPKRAEKSAWLAAFYAMVFLFGISILFFLFSDQIILVFSNDSAVLTYGRNSLRIICLGYIFFAYGMVLSQAYNGSGDTRTPTAVNFLCFWLVQIPLAYLMSITLDIGPNGVFWAIAISESILAAIFVYLFRKGKWKTTVI